MGIHTGCTFGGGFLAALLPPTTTTTTSSNMNSISLPSNPHLFLSLSLLTGRHTLLLLPSLTLPPFLHSFLGSERERERVGRDIGRRWSGPEIAADICTDLCRRRRGSISISSFLPPPTHFPLLPSYGNGHPPMHISNKALLSSQRNGRRSLL